MIYFLREEQSDFASSRIRGIKFGDTSKGGCKSSENVAERNNLLNNLFLSLISALMMYV